MKVYSTVTGNNADLFEHIAPLYIPENAKIADVTYGKGVFWKNIKRNVINSDIKTVPERPYDFTDLPYKDEIFDIVVLDPPYMHNAGRPIVNDNYQNKETTKGFYHDDIIKLYHAGIKEAKRILKKEGLLFIKCQDEIESGIQRWSHIEIYNLCISEKLYGKDLIILNQKNNPHIQYKQKHVRKKHSYLWVFQKVSENKFNNLKRRNKI